MCQQLGEVLLNPAPGRRQGENSTRVQEFGASRTHAALAPCDTIVTRPTGVGPDAPPVQLLGPEQPNPPGLELMRQVHLEVLPLGPLFDASQEEAKPYEGEAVILITTSGRPAGTVGVRSWR